MRTNFVVDHLGETPDVYCIDHHTDKKLNLEITLLEDLPGEIKYVLGRGRKPISPTTKSTAVSFFDDSVEQLEHSLEKKLLSVYGPNTALVIIQVSILWEPKEWDMIADDFRKRVLMGKEQNYGAGVWIICTDNSTWPASDTLFCLSKPVPNS